MPFLGDSKIGRQALNFFNKCSENSSSQIVFRTDIFLKWTLGAPDICFMCGDLKKMTNTGM